MRDAYAGIVNLVFVVVFLMVISGVLGLIVSYTKAFKMKDSVISTIEHYEGSGCYKSGDDISDTACAKTIIQIANNLKYAPSSISSCPSGFYAIKDGSTILACVRKNDSPNHMDIGNRKNVPVAVFTVSTRVDLTFPLIDKITGLSVFQVTGDTKVIEIQS